LLGWIAIAEWNESGQDALDYLGLSHDEMEDISDDALTDLEEIHTYR